MTSHNVCCAILVPIDSVCVTHTRFGLCIRTVCIVTRFSLCAKIIVARLVL
jgi:hypothetical protein